MTNQSMPGLDPALFNPALKWHAIQVTVYEHSTKTGKKVTADIRAKLSRAERWDDCALITKISLQGRSRDANRAMFKLSESLIQHGHTNLRDHMLSDFAKTKDKLIDSAGANNSQWKSTYIRSGFGRDPSATAWVAGTSSMQPLNPGIYAHFDRSSMLINFTIGHFNLQTQIETKLSANQKKVNAIGHSIILLDAPVYAALPETGAQRLARFMSAGRETNTV